MRDYSGPKSFRGLFKVLVGIFDSKQDNIPGIKGQLVGFDDSGKPVAQEPPDTGVVTFKGRKGNIDPLAGDYTATMVGADPVGSAAKVEKKLTDVIGQQVNALTQKIKDTLDPHVTNRNNPHGVTAQQAGALPTTGGTLTGPLVIGKMRISWNQSEQSIDIEVI